MRQAQSLLSRIESVPRRELYFFALYRLLEAGILAALMFSPLGEVLGEPRHPELGTAVTIGYLRGSTAGDTTLTLIEQP